MSLSKKVISDRYGQARKWDGGCYATLLSGMGADRQLSGMENVGTQRKSDHLFMFGLNILSLQSEEEHVVQNVLLSCITAIDH